MTTGAYRLTALLSGSVLFLLLAVPLQEGFWSDATMLSNSLRNGHFSIF